MTDTNGSTSPSPNINTLQKEWDEICCPICMEHPHNAVLLICACHEKGCRSYICDTSYRHSNCLDRYKKLKVDHNSELVHSRPITSFRDHSGMLEASDEHNNSPRHRHSDGQVEHSGVEESVNHNLNLKCPLCRGAVMEWRVVKDARQYLDTKPRSCSRESCSFSGNYGELRRHARRIHPMTRPADVDPSRQRAWHHMEHEREYGDILSAIRSAMPGSVTFGDYVINGEDLLPRDHELGSDTRTWWATLFLFHMMSRPSRSWDEFGSASLTRRSRRRSSSSVNRYLWGENLLGLQDDHDGDDEEILMPRRRRRMTRSRTDEE